MDIKNVPEAFKKVWEKVKSIKYVLIVVLVGLVLIILPDSTEKKQTANSEESKKVTEFSLSEEEIRIAEALSEIDGAGNVRVVLSVCSSEEKIIAVDTESYTLQENGEKREESSVTAVIISEDGGESPITVRMIYPEYRGALIVAEGAGNAETRLRLVQAVADLTGLSSEKITVVKMKNS